MHPRNTVKLNTSCGLRYSICLHWLIYKWWRRRKFDITSLILGFARLCFESGGPGLDTGTILSCYVCVCMFVCIYVCNARVIYSRYMYNILCTTVSVYVCHIYIYIHTHTHTHTHTLYCWLLLAKYYKGGHRKENEMGKKCGRHGWEEKCLQNFGRETCSKEITWKFEA